MGYDQNKGAEGAEEAEKAKRAERAERVGGRAKGKVRHADGEKGSREGPEGAHRGGGCGTRRRKQINREGDIRQYSGRRNERRNSVGVFTDGPQMKENEGRTMHGIF